MSVKWFHYSIFMFYKESSKDLHYYGDDENTTILIADEVE